MEVLLWSEKLLEKALADCIKNFIFKNKNTAANRLSASLLQRNCAYDRASSCKEKQNKTKYSRIHSIIWKNGGALHLYVISKYSKGKWCLDSATGDNQVINIFPFFFFLKVPAQQAREKRFSVNKRSFPSGKTSPFNYLYLNDLYSDWE